VSGSESWDRGKGKENISGTCINKTLNNDSEVMKLDRMEDKTSRRRRRRRERRWQLDEK